MPLPGADGKPVVPPKQSATETTLAQVGRVLGDSGTERYSGYFTEEYNPEWRDERRVENVEKMRRSDSAARAALRAVKAPMMATAWSVTTATADDARAEEIRAFVEANLFGMKRTWKEFLREALAYLDFGHYCFELIWEERAGKIVLADLAPRIPHSIQRWELPDGRFGIVQWVRTNQLKTFQLEVPGDKLLVLTNDKEGDDVTGQSVLRAAWKHFTIKDVLYRIQGIAAERYGVGIPVITMPDAAGSDEKDEAEDIGASLRSNQKGYIVWKNGWQLDIKTPDGNPQGQAIETAIEHHDKQILRAVLASFLALGSDGVGSYALSRDQSSFFLKAVEDMACYFAEQMNKQVVKKIVDLNFGPQEIYPRLYFSPLGDIDYGEMATSLNTLAMAGLIRTDSRTMEHVHKAFGLPEIPQDTLDAIREREAAETIGEIEEEDGPPAETPAKP